MPSLTSQRLIHKTTRNYVYKTNAVVIPNLVINCTISQPEPGNHLAKISETGKAQPPNSDPRQPEKPPEKKGRIWSGRNYKWWALASVATGTLVTVADMGEVNVAMPTIADQFSSHLSTRIKFALALQSCSTPETSVDVRPSGRISRRPPCG